MKSAIIAIAVLMSGTAIAQTEPMDAEPPADMGVTTQATITDPAPAATPSTGSVQMPSNANPEHDARGIAVISDPAIVPAGYNGTTATGVGGPLTDPATGEAVNPTDTSHPPCSRTVTDNCVQTYERGRSPQ